MQPVVDSNADRHRGVLAAGVRRPQSVHTRRAGRAPVRLLQRGAARTLFLSATHTPLAAAAVGRLMIGPCVSRSDRLTHT